MIRSIALVAILSLMSCAAKKQLAVSMPSIGFEADSETSASYREAVSYYEQLAQYSTKVAIYTAGKTDSGYPLHEVVISMEGHASPQKTRAAGKAVMLINNAIHAGEPCGIDASMMLARDLVTTYDYLLDEVTVIIIPVYNVGGALQRGSHSRANQVGPVEYGFRGNAKNLDLNRDFIKSDSRNAQAFAEIFHRWKPQVLVDNHTSNGADYQYVMTLIPTQKDKLHPILSAHMKEKMLPELYDKMAVRGYEMTPYVYSVGSTPDEGIAGFLDYGRYSSGYAALHHTIGFMPETHMLKAYADRVRSTYHFGVAMVQHVAANAASLILNQETARRLSAAQEEWPLLWSLDRQMVDTISFKGYVAGYKPSEITGADRLYYDRAEPYEKAIAHYNTYAPSLTVQSPVAYIIPQAYPEIVDLLQANGVQLEQLSTDKEMEVETYIIEDYTSSPRPYEGHYLHKDVEVRVERQTVQYRAGDYVVYTQQPSKRFIVETLEPQAADSYFNWNFFDGILMQKEHYSAYVWEGTASEILKTDAALKVRFEDKKRHDKDFASDPTAQLEYLYKESKYHEPSYCRYPVGRLTVTR